MKILYTNPIFLDYRIPYYNELSKLNNGDFYVLYSPSRYKNRFDSLLEKIPRLMGKNAIPFNKEKVFYTGNWSFSFSDKGHRIPIIKGLFRTIRKIKPDILISEGFYQWTPIVLLYSIIFRIPLYIGYERTMYTERNSSLLKKIHRKITNKAVTGYLANGIETKEYLKSLGINENKIFIAGMSADSKGLRKGISEMSEEDINSFKLNYQKQKGLIYLFSGRITYAKGVMHLFEAWKLHLNNHPDDILILIGDGDLYKQCSEDTQDIPSIFMEGRINYDLTYKYYAIANVFILPTLQDNWSLVIPEAMACGLPIATSIYNGCHTELVKKEVNGITFDSFKIETIVEALDYFHHKDLKELGRNSIELEKYFNTENSALRTYNAIIQNSKR